MQLLQSKHTVFLWQADRLVAGKAVIFAQEPIGAISIGLPTAPLQAKVAAARDRGILVALAAAIAAALLATIVSRSITQPLQQLTAATQRLAKGDLSQTLQLHHSDDEIVILARAFNSMAYGLRLNGHLGMRLGVRIASMGYAVSGLAIAAGIARSIGQIDKFSIFPNLRISGTISALVLAYLVRFLAISFNTVDSGLAKIKPNLDDAARSLGYSPTATLLKVHAPGPHNQNRNESTMKSES